MFDAVGTLIHATPGVVDVYADFGRRHGSEADSAKIARRFYDAFDQHFSNADSHESSEDVERVRWQAVVSHVFEDLPSTTDLFDDIWQHFASPGVWTTYSDVAATIEQLVQADFKLAIASNFDSRLHAICRATPELESFANVFVSTELRHRKPATEFFLNAQKQLGFDATELLFVGDHFSHDVEAAQTAGWQALHVDRKRTCGCQHCIHSLGDVAEILIR